MAYRTTIKTLRTLVATLNNITGNPTEAWARNADGVQRAVPGVYVLDCAYGGYRLCRIVSESGGERDITPRYGATMTADLIRAYMCGFGDAERKTRLAA